MTAPHIEAPEAPRIEAPHIEPPLDDLLPPGDPTAAPADLPAAPGEQPLDEPAREYSADEIEVLNEQTDNLIALVASQGARQVVQLVPPDQADAVRAQYVAGLVGNMPVRAAVQMSGLPELAERLMPIRGADAAVGGPVYFATPPALRRLPEWARLGLGLLALSVSVAVQTKVMTNEIRRGQQ